MLAVITTGGIYMAFDRLLKTLHLKNTKFYQSET
jgi:hypothetical protein